MNKASLIIPVRDRPHFLMQAVRSAIAQELPPLEVVVVDDGSYDDPTALLAPLGRRVRVIRQPRLGRSAARNRGAKEARGDVLAFLDSDDLWVPGKLARQLAVLEKRPEAGLITGFVSVVNGSGEPQPLVTQQLRRTLLANAATGFSLERLVRAPGIFTSTLLVPRRVFEEVGGFDESLDALEDWDFMLKIRAHHPFEVVPWPPVVIYRRHSGNTDADAMARAAMQVASRYLGLPAASQPRVRASLLVRKALAERTCLQQACARRSVLEAIRTSPTAALAGGAARLLAGALLPQRLAACLAVARRSSRRQSGPPERIDPAEVSRGVLSHHLAKYVFAGRLISGTRVLDVGCGVGYGSRTLAAPGRLVVGVDFSEEAVIAAIRRYRSSGVVFARMDAERLACPDEAFDAVVCFEAIEHFRQPRHHIQEVARVLKPGGTYIVSTPRPGTGGTPLLNPHHHYEFSAVDLASLLRPYFVDIIFLGQRRRQTRIHRVTQKADIFGLRRLTFVRPIARRLSRLLGTEPVESAGVDDFRIDAQGAVSGGEFVIVCRRPAEGKVFPSSWSAPDVTGLRDTVLGNHTSV